MLLDEQRTAIRRPSCPTTCLAAPEEDLAGFMSSSGDQNAHSAGTLDRSDSPVLGFWGGDAQRRPVMVSVDGESLVVVVREKDKA